MCHNEHHYPLISIRIKLQHVHSLPVSYFLKLKDIYMKVFDDMEASIV